MGAHRSSPSWKEEDNEIIRRHYPVYPKDRQSSKELLLKKLSERNWRGIQLQASFLGVRRNVAWSHEEDSRLAAHWVSSLKKTVLQELPNRTWSEISQRASTLGIVRCHSDIHYRRGVHHQYAKLTPRRWKFDWSEENVRAAVLGSKGLFEALRHITGGTNSPHAGTLRKCISEYKLDTAHWLTTDELQKAYRLKRHKDDERFFVYGQHRPSDLRERYKFLRRDDRCDICGGKSEWMGKSLTIQLDHINGDPKDNRLENLRWCCPNCHSQTPNFARKNIKRRIDAKLPQLSSEVVKRLQDGCIGVRTVARQMGTTEYFVRLAMEQMAKHCFHLAS